MPSYDIRPYESGDEERILATFNLVFGEGDPGFVERSLEEWRWAYPENPAGMRLWVAECGDEIVAHYGSQPSRVWIEGEERIFAQITDSMVHPAHRRGLKRPGLFVETARRMLAATCGIDRDLVTYGWPVPEAWRIGRAFLGYEIVRTQNLLYSSLVDVTSTALPEGAFEIERFDHEARWVYDRCAGDWGASIVRDADFLNWRFFDRPGVDYHALGVRDGAGLLRGIAVCRRGHFVAAGDSLAVMEWLVPPDEVEVGERMREACRALGRRLGLPVSGILIPEWSPWFARFQEWGWRVHTTEYLMSGRNNHPRHDMEWLRDHWWYQFTEMDLL